MNKQTLVLLLISFLLLSALFINYRPKLIEKPPVCAEPNAKVFIGVDSQGNAICTQTNERISDFDKRQYLLYKMKIKTYLRCS